MLAHQSSARLALGEVAEAEALSQRATKLSRYSADVVFAEAELALYHQNYQLAREALHEVKLLEPDFPYAPARLGEIALLDGDAESAERDFREAVEQRFGTWRDRLNLGIARLQQGKTEAAARDAEALLASSATNGEVHLFAYRVYTQMGEPQQARAALEPALRRLSDQAQAPGDDARDTLEQGTMQLEAGNLDAAAALIEQALAMGAGGRRDLCAGLGGRLVAAGRRCLPGPIRERFQPA